LYLAIGGLAFLFLGAVLQILGVPPSRPLGLLVQSITVILGVSSFILGAIGSIGLIYKRVSDPVLNEYSAGIDFLNLGWLAAIFVTGFLVWLGDPGFTISRDFLVSLITFKPVTTPMSALHVLNLLLFIGFWAYFPFTHMTHMVSKYFMWDKVKWDDNPNVGDPGMDSKIRKYLGYPVTWSAPHVQSDGTKTWADVATTNPWAEDKK
jgi:nitrate reductase gamma subunit